MKPIYFFCFALILMVLPTEILSAIDQKSVNLIKKTCQDTPNQDYCNTMLKTSNVADVNDIIEILLKTAKLQARKNAKRIKELSGKTPEDNKKLKNCVKNFDDAVEMSRDAFSALGSKQYPIVLEKMNGATKNANSCVDSFGTGKKAPGQNTPMSEICQEYLRTCSIVTSIISKNMSGGKKGR